MKYYFLLFTLLQCYYCNITPLDNELQRIQLFVKTNNNTNNDIIITLNDDKYPLSFYKELMSACNKMQSKYDCRLETANDKREKKRKEIANLEKQHGKYCDLIMSEIIKRDVAIDQQTEEVNHLIPWYHAFFQYVTGIQTELIKNIIVTAKEKYPVPISDNNQHISPRLYFQMYCGIGNKPRHGYANYKTTLTLHIK